MNTMLRCTVNRQIAKNENENQTIPVSILLNEDHIRAIEPRTEGGSVVLFADKSAMIIAESMSEILEKLEPKAADELVN